MSSYAGPSAPRPESVAETLRLLAFLAAAIALITLDHRGGWLRAWRNQAELAVQPLWMVAGLPGRMGEQMRNDAVSRSQLVQDNAVLRNALLVSGARVARLQAAQAENERLRALLGAAQRERLDVQLAPIFDIDLDPTRQRLILDAGSNQGVHVGQVVIDAGGVLGQVIETKPRTSTVLLLTDPDHALPVEVVRTGMRAIVYGRGDHMSVANVPRSADLKVGDVLQTSGLGGRFPPGFPVGTIGKLRLDDSRAFLEGTLVPAAQINRGREVLLLRSLPTPTAPAPAKLPAGPTPAMGAPR